MVDPAAGRRFVRLQVADAAAVEPYRIVVDLLQQLVADRQEVRSSVPVLAIRRQHRRGRHGQHKLDARRRKQLLHRRQIRRIRGDVIEALRAALLDAPASVVCLDPEPPSVFVHDLLDCGRLKYAERCLGSVEDKNGLQLVGQQINVDIRINLRRQAALDLRVLADVDIRGGVCRPRKLFELRAAAKHIDFVRYITNQCPQPPPRPPVPHRTDTSCKIRRPQWPQAPIGTRSPFCPPVFLP